MARSQLLLLTVSALGALSTVPGLQAEGRAASYGVKLCGREFIRAVIFTCGGSRWRREDVLPQDAAGDTFLDADVDTDSLTREWDDTLGSSEWLTLTKAPQTFYGGRLSWQGGPGVFRGSRDVLAGLSSTCCKYGCSKREISSLC